MQTHLSSLRKDRDSQIAQENLRIFLKLKESGPRSSTWLS